MNTTLARFATGAVVLLLATFALAQKITVTQPNGGEVWAVGTMHYVDWTFQGGEGPTVTVELLKGGEAVQTLTSSATTNQGYYPWTLGSNLLAGDDYTVQVTSNSKPEYSGESSAPFTIQSGSMRLGWPNANDIAVRGRGNKVQWAYTGNPGATVKIDLYQGGSFNSTIAAAAPIGTGGTGSIVWTPPSSLAYGTNYSLLLTSTADATITAQSSGPFRIEPGSIRVTYPTGGETLIYGWCYDFTWAYSGAVSSTVNVQIIDTAFPDGGTGPYAGPNASGGTGTFHNCMGNVGPLRVTYGITYELKVSDASNPDISATSANTFKLQPGSIRVTSPNGGEAWARGSTHSITWAWAEDIGGSVKIELLLNHAVVSTVAASAPSDDNSEDGDPPMGTGSFSWTIPTTLPAGGGYQVRVSSDSNDGASTSMLDASDAPFTLE